MVKVIISYVDSHVIVEEQKGVRVFNSIADAVEYINVVLDSASVPTPSKENS